MDAAEFCQGVIIPAVDRECSRMSASPPPLKLINGWGTGGRGGPERASWVEFQTTDGERFVVTVTKGT